MSSALTPIRLAGSSSLMHARWPVRVAHDLHGFVASTWTSALLVGSYGLAALLSIAPARNQQARVRSGETRQRAAASRARDFVDRREQLRHSSHRPENAGATCWR